MGKTISLQEIKQEFSNMQPEDIPQAIACYKGDERKSVQSFLVSMQKRYDKYQEELARIYEMASFERKYSDRHYICGIDEVGRGPLAGPVVTAAVVLPKDCRILYINDSKKLSAAKRDELFEEICDKALAIGVGMMNHEVIDEINILQATYAAMRMAVASLNTDTERIRKLGHPSAKSACGRDSLHTNVPGETLVPDLLLIDAVHIPQVDIQQISIIKGDARSMSIAAASIVAKVIRDHMMCEFDSLYPEYGFASNKGYGSASHIEALKKMGSCPIHRQSFIGNFVK